MRVAILLMFFLVLPCVCIAQEVLDEATARVNLVKAVDPDYPPIARAAMISGPVVVSVGIDPAGKVALAKVLSGPQMLWGAALTAVKQWTFTPFLFAGQPTAVDTKMTIPFTLANGQGPSELATARVYFQLDERCKTLVRQGGDTVEQARACRVAALEADKFPSSTRFIERRSAYVYCTIALLRNKDWKEALLYGKKAVEVVRQGHDDESGASAAYSVKAQAEGMLGDLTAADSDNRTAIKEQRAALAGPAGESLHGEYTRVLKNLLLTEAQILSGLGKKDEAVEATKEARSF